MTRSAFAAALMLLMAAAALQAEEQTFPARGSVQIAFTPGDAADRAIVDAIARAHSQVLIQAFSFTHRRIADALLAAHRRGVEVRLIVDRDQGLRHSRRLMDSLAAAGVPILLDGAHDAAHSKAIVLDASADDCTVVTGSYNFTYAAQHRNAENVVLMRGNPALCEAFAREWQRHAPHARAHRPPR